ncbi:MAG: acyltransferase [Phycisphaeraceae bacterium]|nr:MAG: acyltransferase [Phycisphaeraceae bacterium]
MTRSVRASLVQASFPELCPDPSLPPARLKSRLIDAHVGLVQQAAAAGANLVCLQELFYAPYFPAEQNTRWLELAEPVGTPDSPDAARGPTLRLMQDLATKLGVVLIVPIAEEAMTGVIYNAAAVLAPDGRLLGTYRKHHLPHCHPGFWEKFYFKPGTGGYPVFDTPFGRVGVYICYDRHFPEGARALGLGGAEIVFNPSATVAGLSEYLWSIEQPAHAVANQYFVGAINRAGAEAPWNIGEFYGSSYFCDPRGQTLAKAPRSGTHVLTADLDLGMIRSVREVWQFYRDRRPETYGSLTGERP